KHERQNIYALFDGCFILDLCDAQRLSVWYVPTTERHKQNTQIAAVESFLREVFRLIAVGSPIFHRVHRETCPAQRTDYVSSMILQIHEGGRYECPVSHNITCASCSRNLSS